MDITVQDDVRICPRCSSALRKIHTEVDIVYVCTNNDCKTVLKAVDKGQSECEIRCEVLYEDRT